MATVKTNKSPLHINCTVGQPYGEQTTSYSCGFHTGIDFPGSGTSETNADLYSCSNNGTVVYVYKDCKEQYESPSLGNQVQIRDEETGIYYRYCHMLYGSITVNVGDKVTTKTKLGKMGTTGNSTGIHLHLEASTSQNWDCNNFLNPGDSLGIPNIRGTVVEYDEITPTPTDWIYKNEYLSESEMQNNAVVIYNYLKNKGYSLEVISALLGNMQRESTLEPLLTERGGRRRIWLSTMDSCK